MRILWEKVSEALLKSRQTISTAVPSSTRQVTYLWRFIRLVRRGEPGKSALTIPDDFIVIYILENGFQDQSPSLGLRCR